MLYCCGSVPIEAKMPGPERSLYVLKRNQAHRVGCRLMNSLFSIVKRVDEIDLEVYDNSMLNVDWNTNWFVVSRRSWMCHRDVHCIICDKPYGAARAIQYPGARKQILWLLNYDEDKGLPQPVR